MKESAGKATVWENVLWKAPLVNGRKMRAGVTFGAKKAQTRFGTRRRSFVSQSVVAWWLSPPRRSTTTLWRGRKRGILTLSGSEEQTRRSSRRGGGRTTAITYTIITYVTYIACITYIMISICVEVDAQLHLV